MANEQHLGILKQGVDVWNRWREENPAIIPDLERAKPGARLRQSESSSVPVAVLSRVPVTIRTGRKKVSFEAYWTSGR